MIARETSRNISTGEDREQFRWQRILESIGSGALAPFLGAGVSNPPLAKEMVEATHHPLNRGI